MCIIVFAIRYMIIISTNTRVITPHCGVFFYWCGRGIFDLDVVRLYSLLYFKTKSVIQYVCNDRNYKNEV